MKVTTEERVILKKILRQQKALQRLGKRIKIILSTTEVGITLKSIAQQLGVSWYTVQKWIKHWRKERAQIINLAAKREEFQEMGQKVATIDQADFKRCRSNGSSTQIYGGAICSTCDLACEPPELSGCSISHWAIRELTGKHVLSTTLFPYIRQVEAHIHAERIFTDPLSKIWTVLPSKTRKKFPSPPRELGMLHGILGNSHPLKDHGAALYYSSSKGKYYFGRIARIIMDTWSQIPLWITVTAPSHSLAKDLENLGHQTTQLRSSTVRPLLLLLDKDFEERIE